MTWKVIKVVWEWLGSSSACLAQLAHIGWGGFLTLAVATWCSPWWAVLVVFAFALFKEFSEFWTETSETRGSTIGDIIFWSIGILSARLVLR